MNRLGIEMLTLLGMPPVEHVKLAAALGCVSISTGLTGLALAPFGYPDVTLYPEWSLESDAAMRREMKAALRDTGVHIGLGEGFRVRPDGDVRDRGAGLDIMAELGALRINAVSMETDMARTHDQLAALADMVIDRGMMFTLEFAPPNAIDSLQSALATVEDLAALDPDLVGYAQLCDAPLVSKGGTYMQEAMFVRMVPGSGELPLRQWIAALPADVEIGLEVPRIQDLQGGMSPRDHAARCVAAARDLGA